MGEARIRSDRLPRHVAIIMDGNGRWAQARGLERNEGHQQGLEALREVVRASNDFGVRYLTLYAFSIENWKRPQGEVGELMRLVLERLASLPVTQMKELEALGDAELLDALKQQVWQ